MNTLSLSPSPSSLDYPKTSNCSETSPICMNYYLPHHPTPSCCCYDSYVPENVFLNRCNKDTKKLKALNITQTQIADRLDSIILRAFEVLHRNLRYENVIIEESFTKAGAHIDGKFKITFIHQNWCVICCPLQSTSNAIKKCVKITTPCCTIKNRQTHKKIHINGIFSHLVRDYGFFGIDTKFRISPRRLVQFLELKKEENYKLDMVEKMFWIKNKHFNEDFQVQCDIFQIAKNKKILLYFIHGCMANFNDLSVYQKENRSSTDLDEDDRYLSSKNLELKKEIFEGNKTKTEKDTKKIWEDQKEQYLHLFFPDNEIYQGCWVDYKPKRFIIESAELVLTGEERNHIVYRLSKESVPVLGLNDKLNKRMHNKLKSEHVYNEAKDCILVVNFNSIISDSTLSKEESDKQIAELFKIRYSENCL